MNWEEYQLGDILSIKHGYAFKGEFFTDTPNSNILVTPGNFNIGGGFKDGKLKFYDGDIPLAFVLTPGDVIVTMTDLSKLADTLGFSAVVPNDGKTYLHNQRIGLVELKDRNFDLGYIYWLLRSEGYQRFIAGSASGATVKHTSPSKIYAYKFKAPSDPEARQKIARILFCYDNLIENNLKRIKLLEELAQLTYEQWFVRREFPGYESTPVDPETRLPKGWKARRVESLCSKITDGTHDSPKQVEDGVPLITGKHLIAGTINFETAYLISREDHEKIKKRSGLEKGDILFSNIGTLGSSAMLTQDFEFSCKNVVIFKRKLGFNNFLYTYLANVHTKNKLDCQSAGSAQKFYSLKFIRNLSEILPEDSIIQKFDEATSHIYKLKYQLYEQNQLLKEARDILLPRLMTGMIDIDQVELPESLLTTEAA